MEKCSLVMLLLKALRFLPKAVSNSSRHIRILHEKASMKSLSVYIAADSLR